jgi:hypothetical protein
VELTIAPLDARSWAHTTRTFETLGYRFAVRSTHAGIGRFVDEMFAACAVPDARPVTWYSIIDDLPGDRPHAVYVDDDRGMVAADPARVLTYLTWSVNQQVIAHRGEHVLVHAAAAALDDVGVILPAATEAGKTTLVAGLVRAGFQYLTDEATAIDPVSLQLLPYPKPLSIDPGSWEPLADLEPRVDCGTGAYLRRQWQVTPLSIRDDAVSGPVDAAVAVFPRYVPGASTVLEPARRSEAMITLLQQTFRFHESGARYLEVLARFLERVACYRLVSGDLDEACDALVRITRDARERSVEDGERR